MPGGAGRQGCPGGPRQPERKRREKGFNPSYARLQMLANRQGVVARMPVVNLSERFPDLAALAKANGTTLESLAETSRLSTVSDSLLGEQEIYRPRYLRLEDICYWAANLTYRQGAPDPISYLATLDEFLRWLGDREAPRTKAWSKLVGGPESAVFDTVSEAACTLAFAREGVPVEVEKPFYPSGRPSKDADIFVIREGREQWLDVVSFDLTESGRSGKPLADELERRVRRKYDTKFQAVVAAGRVSCVGILCSLLKSEASVWPFLLHTNLPERQEIFAVAPGLALVSFFTLSRTRDSDRLTILPVGEWRRPA